MQSKDPMTSFYWQRLLREFSSRVWRLVRIVLLERGKGSFDSVFASLREAETPLRMTVSNKERRSL
jgi:hypothetical protein